MNSSVTEPRTIVSFGVRRQSEATTALWMCAIKWRENQIQSGVALRLPPHSNYPAHYRSRFCNLRFADGVHFLESNTE